MNENLLRGIKNELNAKHYVMNDTWLRDCVTYFIRDETRKMTDRQIVTFVQGQWLLSDLREISNEKGCLPKNLIQKVHTILTGTYILQVNKMYDIANSKYNQLCEIRKVNNENLEVMEEDDKQKAEWKPKPRRMIQLCLTDGVQDITAIEYKPLKQMTMLLPGYKVMITGPVNCRRGVILLEEGKYKEVGGEVESLLKSNALENVLARALEEPENPNPYDIPLPRNVNQNTQEDNFKNKDSLFDDDFEEIVDLEVVTAIERQNQEIIQSNSNNMHAQKQTGETTDIMEDFLEDIDFEPLENWPNDSSTRSVLPTMQMEVERLDDNDVIIVEETSVSTLDSRSKPSTANSFKNQRVSEFLEDDFNFDDCDIMINLEKSRSHRNKNLSKSETKAYPLPKSKLITRDTSREVERNISHESFSTKGNKKSVASTSQTAKTETINVLKDILSKPVIGKVHKIVKAQVKSHSALQKQNKHWTVTALIADHTSSIEVCFDSEVIYKKIFLKRLLISFYNHIKL